jgi:hypothetical protein
VLSRLKILLKPNEGGSCWLHVTARPFSAATITFEVNEIAFYFLALHHNSTGPIAKNTEKSARIMTGVERTVETSCISNVPQTMDGVERNVSVE